MSSSQVPVTMISASGAAARSAFRIDASLTVNAAMALGACARIHVTLPLHESANAVTSFPPSESMIGLTLPAW